MHAPDERRRRRRARGLLVLLPLLLGAGTAGAHTVAVLYDPARVPHVRFVAAFEEALTERSPRARLVLRPLGADLPERRPRLVVAVGQEALEAALAGELPVLAVLVPRVTLEATAARAGRRLAPEGTVTAVYLDQPPARRLRLVRLVLPGARTLAVLLGPTSRRQRPRLVQAARVQGFRLRIGEVGPADRPPRVAETLLPGTDGLLAVPDPVVYNRYTLHGILLSAYHRHVPMFGFSKGYVRAGALAAVYSEPQDVARTAAELGRRMLRRNGVPPPVHPRHFRVAVNRHVARSLAIMVPDERALEARLRAAEERPR